MTHKTEKLNINAVIDPLAATVRVHNTAGGPLATFDVAGVPRVDGMLTGRPAASVPTLVTRLCGLCPVTHHLAGIAALDQLAGAEPGPYAAAVRALLHHASVVDVMGPRLIPDHALELKKAAKAAMAAAGCPGHFPDVAVPGGVKVTAAPGGLDSEIGPLLELIPEASGPAPESYGARLVVADASGEPDPLGTHLRVSLGDVTDTFPASEVPERIRESAPGSITPRPEVFVTGEWHPYIVGPVARYPELGPRAAQLRELADSLAACRDLAARLASMEPELTGELPLADGTGIGLVDGPRGLLIHRYTVSGGVLTECQILSPTAQNEGWLAHMLTTAVREGGDPRAVEAAIRAADPCLPCTSAPEGQMNVTIVHEKR